MYDSVLFKASEYRKPSSIGGTNRQHENRALRVLARTVYLVYKYVVKCCTTNQRLSPELRLVILYLRDVKYSRSRPTLRLIGGCGEVVKQLRPTLPSIELAIYNSA